MDDLISELIDFGFTRQELSHLERLSDPAVLNELPTQERYLKHNIKSDVVKYLNVWAAALERTLLNEVDICDAIATVPAVNE